MALAGGMFDWRPMTVRAHQRLLAQGVQPRRRSSKPRHAS